MNKKVNLEKKNNPSAVRTCALSAIFNRVVLTKEFSDKRQSHRHFNPIFFFFAYYYQPATIFFYRTYFYYTIQPVFLVAANLHKFYDEALLDCFSIVLSYLIWFSYRIIRFSSHVGIVISVNYLSLANATAVVVINYQSTLCNGKLVTPC